MHTTLSTWWLMLLTHEHGVASVCTLNKLMGTVCYSLGN